MVGEAAGFALLAAISPTALLMMAVFLSSASPRQTALMYVAGAMLMSVAMAVAVLFVIRAAGLNQPRQHDPRYGLRLGLGVLALVAVAVIAVRGQNAAGGSGSEKGMMSRLVAAVQVVATANADVPVTALALVVVVVVTVLIVWLPLLAYLAAPDATTRRLDLLNGWLRAHARTLAIAGLTIGGIVLIVNGALGLAGVL
jgi:hypothetical protein